MRLFRFAVVLLAGILLVAPRAAAGQTASSGVLEGTVRDTAGIPLEDALLTLTAPSGATRSARTGPGGLFRLDFLPEGRYELSAERIGYPPRRVTGIAVRAGGTVRLEVLLGRAGGAPLPAEAVAHSGARARSGFGPTGRLRLDGEDLAALPGDGRQLGELAALSTALPLGGPLHPAFRVDGVPLSPLHLPGHRADPLGAAPVSVRALASAVIESAAADVEWGTGSAFIRADSRSGEGGFSVGGYGAWGVGSLAPADGFGPGSVPHDGMEGGLSLSGPLAPGKAEFALGADFLRSETPLQLTPGAGELTAALVGIARDSFRLELGAAPEVIRTDRASAFARVDWRPSAAHTVLLRGAGSTLLSPREEASYGLWGGGAASATEASLATVVTSRWSPWVHQEVRVGIERGTRDLEPARIGGGVLPGMRIAAGPIALGADPEGPGSVERTRLETTGVLFARAGAHRLKAGGGMALARHRGSYAPASAGAFFFSGVDDIAAGTGVFHQAVGGEEAEFSLSRTTLFLQDTWTPAAGVQLLAGIRYDRDRLPTGGSAPDSAWGKRTGMSSATLPGSAALLSPRFALTIDPGARGEWLFRASGGLYAEEPDSRVLVQALADDGRIRVRRGAEVPFGGTTLPDPAELPFVGRSLTVVTPGYAPPRTARGEAGVSRALPAGMAVHLTLGWSRTEWLPRHTDLNLLPEPTGYDRHGRPLYGTLEQRGSLLFATPGSSRRFPAFDRVSGVDADGWHERRAATVALEHTPAEALRLLGSYTYSETRDNLASWPGAGGASLTPALADSAADWSEGRSDHDAPHRALLLGELRLDRRFSPALSLLYRYRSGLPFTPGFRDGVDANGDGAANDPAFVDEAIEGVAPLLAEWSCLRAGRFAARNSCRSPGVHALDVRLGMELFQGGGRSGRVTLDALNLVGSQPGAPDRALFLVDPQGTLTTDAEGRTVVPLVANPRFGRPLLRRSPGRAFRLGLHLTF